MRRKCEVEAPTGPDFGEEFVSSGVKKMMEADVQGHSLIMSVAVNKRMLARQTEIKDGIKAVHRHHDEGEGEFPSWGVVSKSNWCWCDQFAEENQRKLEEKADML